VTSVALLATPARPAFAHASEAELARILDFYQVRWTYEPDTFPIGWSMTGDVVESFSPDFYLPDLDLYVELTTLKQKLVRKKNRKLRRLRELYPDVRIKLFYARDFRMLLLKFGRLALLDDLSGTTGQATPPRPADRIVTEAGAAAGLGGPSLDAALGAGDDQGGHDDLDDEGGDAAGLAAALTVTPLRAAAAPQAPSATRGRRRGRRRRRDGADAGVGAGSPDMPGIAVIAGLTGPDAVGEPA
jgi:hypoxanthine phosphoribosyltransferase